MTFAIDHDVPAPEPRRSNRAEGVGRPIKYPFEHMAVGDSLFVENIGNNTSVETRNIVQTSAKNFAYRHRPDWGFTARAIKSGARIWRIA